MSAPIRIQRKYGRGWRMPPNTRYVGHSSRFANPFDWRTFGRSAAVDFFARWLEGALTPEERASTGIDLLAPAEAEAIRQRLLDGITQLRGKNLCCWCPLVNSHGEYVPCHADVLLELANR